SISLKRAASLLITGSRHDTPIREGWASPAIAGDIHLKPENPLQLQRHSRMVQQARVVAPRHQKIEVAAGPRFATGHGSDHAYRCRPMLGRDADNLLASFANLPNGIHIRDSPIQMQE